ncbi:MAG: class II aldolase/adducin family protein [Actinomycetota bacterium]
MVSKYEVGESGEAWKILSDLGKRFVDRGLVVGSGGNLSILLPDRKSFLITGTGTSLDRLDEESFAVVGLDGTYSSSGTQPSSEYRVHLAAYQSRSDVTTCIHLHPQASVLLAALGIETKFVTVDHVYYLRKIVRIPWIRPGTQEIADAVAREIAGANVLILENHGCVVVADNPELAYSRALNLEEASELSLRSQMVGIEPLEVPAAYREYLEDKGL